MHQTAGRLVINLLNDVPAGADDEIFAVVLLREDVRIERTVSTGQFTPADKHLRQGHDEWVYFSLAQRVFAFRFSCTV